MKGPWKILLALFAGSTLLRAIFGLLIRQPRIYGDELTYWHMAGSFHTDGSLRFMGHAWDFPSALYPILVSGVLYVNDLFLAYDLARVLNALLVSSIVFVAYGLAREFVDEERAIVVAALAALLPGASYSATIMAENAYFPTFVLAFWMLFRVLAGKGSVVLAALAVGLCYFAKPHVFSLFLGYVAASAVLCVWRFVEGSRKGLLLDVVRQASVVFLFLAWVVPVRVFLRPDGFRGGLKTILMSTTYQNHVSLAPPPPERALLIFLGLLATLVLAVGAAPFGAFLASLARSGKESGPRRAFALLFVFATGVSLLMVTQHILVNDPVPRFHERYLFVLLPMALVAFADEGFRRSKAAAVWCVSGLALFLGLLLFWPPFALTWNDPSDSPARETLQVVSALGLPGFVLFVLFAGLAALALYALRARRFTSGAAALALALAVLNSGWYVFHVRHGNDLAAKRFARDVERAIGTEESVVLVVDELPERAIFDLSFWLSAPPRYQGLTERRSYWWLKNIGPLTRGRSGGLGKAILGSGAAAAWSTDPILETTRLEKPVSLVSLPVSASGEKPAFESDVKAVKIEWGPLEQPVRLAAGIVTLVPVSVTNAGEKTLAAAGATGVSIGYHWADPDHRGGDWSSIVWDDGNRGRLPRSLLAGQTVRVFVPVKPPVLPNTGYRLILVPFIEGQGFGDGPLVVTADVVSEDRSKGVAVNQ